MSTTTTPAVCPLCQGKLGGAGGACPACGATSSSRRRAATLDVFFTWLDFWRQQGRLGEGDYQTLHRQYSDELDRLRRGQTADEASRQEGPALCWCCSQETGSAEHCPGCGAACSGESFDRLRGAESLLRELDEHSAAGRISLFAYHALSGDLKQWMAARVQRLRGSQPPLPAAKPILAQTATSLAAEVAVPPAAAPVPPRQSPAFAAAAAHPSSGSPPTAPRPRGEPARPARRPLWEILLDPHSLNVLLAAGAGLLVVGLVIWLATLGVFKNSLVVAVCLAAGNAVLLVGGWFLVTQTRHPLTGRALALLGCLVMPLHLWFYHSTNLMTLDQHLWVPAVVIVALYALTAYLLRDSVIVYVLAAGTALAGLLILADLHKLYEIGAPAALLVTLGLLAIHAERAFLPGQSAFSRERFGLAFFFSGQALLGAGLLLLMGAQLAFGPLTQLFAGLFRRLEITTPWVITEHSGQLLALCLVLVGTYAYLYSDLVVRRVGVYMTLVVVTILWAELLIIQLLHLTFSWELAISVLAVTAMVVNGALWKWRSEAPSLLRAGPALAAILCSVPVLLGLILHLRANSDVIKDFVNSNGGETYAIGWTYVVAMVLTALSCRLGAAVYERISQTWVEFHFFGVATATILAAAGALSLGLGNPDWAIGLFARQAPILMVIPLLYLGAAAVYGKTPAGKALVLAAEAATAVLAVCVVMATLDWGPGRSFDATQGHADNLLLAVFFAEAAAFYFIATRFAAWPYDIYLATLCACGTVWEAMNYLGVKPSYYTLVFAGIGIVLLVLYRLAIVKKRDTARPMFQMANALLSLSFVSGLLQSLGHLSTGESASGWETVGQLAALCVLSLLAAALVGMESWRQAYVCMAVAEGLVALLAMNLLLHITPWQRVEVITVLAGLALLVTGHVGWYREQVQDRLSDTVSFALLWGSLLVMVPLTMTLLDYRWTFDLTTPQGAGHAWHEVLVLLLGTGLFAAGVLCQVRGTTVVGAAGLAVYLGSLVLFVRWPDTLKTAGVMLTVAGGLLFAGAVLLTMYRERLVALPDKIKRREGIFQLLDWR